MCKRKAEAKWEKQRKMGKEKEIGTQRHVGHVDERSGIYFIFLSFHSVSRSFLTAYVVFGKCSHTPV